MCYDYPNSKFLLILKLLYNEVWTIWSKKSFYSCFMIQLMIMNNFIWIFGKNEHFYYND